MSPPPAFGTYRVLHQIGSGVLGPVFRAYDSDRDTLVAIKTFRLELVPEDAARLAARLRALAGLDVPHPAIAKIVDAGLEGATPYVALEMLPGETLDVALRQLGAFGPARAVRILRTLAEAIDAGAQQELDHGALHPRDVFISAEPDSVRITGFGIARAVAEVGVKPTIRLPFSAPERTAGGEWDRRADVYSLAEIARALLGEAGANEDVQRILDSARSERPPSRPASALALIESLELALLPKPEPAPQQAQPVVPAEPQRAARVVVPPAPKVIEFDRPMVQRSGRADSGFPWVATGAVLLAGLVIGGAVGYQAGWSRAASTATVLAPPPAAVVTSTTVETIPPAPPASAIPQPDPDPAPEPAPVRPARTQASNTGRRSAGAAAAAASKSTGSLDIDTRPRGARVSVDGRPYGTTPLRVPSLAPGNHQVRFELAGHRTVTHTVKIVGGELARFSISLEQVTLAPQHTPKHRER